MPTKKQIIFATFRYIKERHPYLYSIIGAKDCFKISKILVEDFGISSGDKRDCDIIVNYIYKYVRKEGYLWHD